jgi:hypothetical protein
MTEQTVDFQLIPAGELYSPLCNLELFNLVQIDSEVGTLVWPNSADFGPATLHDWTAHRETFEKLARRWELAEVWPERRGRSTILEL